MSSSHDQDSITFLHGDLDITILEARCLPNMDLPAERVRRCLKCFHLCKTPKQPNNKQPRQRKVITSDPYVSVCLAGATVARTRVISNSQYPVWNEHIVTPVAHPVTNVEFQVKDNDVFGADMIGTATISAKWIVSGELIEDWFPILGPFGKPPKPKAALRLKIKFSPCDDDDDESSGCCTGEEEVLGLSKSYFPMRQGCEVTLYQDAHVGEGQLPEISLGGDCERFEHKGCWEDICHAILEARHLVYVVGWSIFDKVKLVREPSKALPSNGELSLGELLKCKSQEGVKVLLLVWDDKTSHDTFFLKMEGVMQTHDEETRKFFKHTNVQCVLAPRYASSKLSIFKQQVVGTLYTHHQKCVLVDTPAHGSYRKISAFLGGLDMCNGRYDTPEHRLFRDRDTVFKDDFSNPTFSAGIKGPRQPWHDLHCKIDGPAAHDVLKNFEQRWKKATKWSRVGQRVKKISPWHEDSLFKIERIPWILCPSSRVPNDDPSLWASKEEDTNTWHVQNLGCSKNVMIDTSIQKAYIKAIRSANHFIYIENQYFLGSSYAWRSNKDTGADHLIPMELSLKIASKIRANERFSVYVVIPMWPEGVPTSAPVQGILFWQGQTIEMMYEIIAREIKNSKLKDAHPLDYLNFYCLGNRERCKDESKKPLDGSSISASQKNGRFMIYVHAKGMIVDDEYVILGSANINQRSMAGSRDTEIAMGAYQPHHTWAQQDMHPHGQVYGYRMSLWAEHLGNIQEYFKEPESLDCVRKINEFAEENWERFASDYFTPLPGHLLKYPIQVDADGKISSLPNHEHFPDVGGKILGAISNLPNALIT